MKLASARVGSDAIFGLVVDAGIVDLRSAFADMIDLVTTSRTPEGRDQIIAAAASRPSISLDDVQLLPPIDRPERILCVGTNYWAHIEESDRVDVAPDYPMIFPRFPSSLVGDGEPIERPTVSTSFDYEGELAIVIGTSVRHADRTAALAAVAGYSCLMDGTLRDYQRHTSQFTAGKNFDRSGSWGPWIVTADEIDDPQDLLLETRVDGEIVQSASTSLMIFDIAAIVSYCSIFTTLQPGDVIATGTPGGVGYARDPQLWLTPGAEVRVTVSGVGELTNTVVDAS